MNQTRKSESFKQLQNMAILLNGEEGSQEQGNLSQAAPFWAPCPATSFNWAVDDCNYLWTSVPATLLAPSNSPIHLLETWT